MFENWKLRLRYGKDKTPFRHYTVLAEGSVTRDMDGFSCRVGPAWMGIKTWALSSDQSADMVQAIARELGFEVTGKIEIYDTEPKEPPRENPHGYDIVFTPFDED